ncbi:MAG TPA: energy transducer TonB [Terriglobales bacterium]|nr:energy transducer TonB [Terriglobales bacterium]
MRFSRAFLLLVLMLSLSANAFTQSVGSATDGRKVTKKLAPSYPELAKRMGVSGAVKLELHVSASGKVRSVKLLGGHPVLADSASQVVRNWEFEAGSDTTELVTVNFNR